MKFTLVPEYRLESFDQVTVEFLLSIDVKAVLLDIDNTLEPYENATPGDGVMRWLDSLWSAGIKTAIVSNNSKERLDTFNKNICMPGFARAGKPFKKSLLRAMQILGTDKDNSIFIGDQILTDVWAAHNAGIKAILVHPINDKKDIFTKFKRILEKPIQEKYDKIHKENK